jgi:hypothetical protein
MASAPVLTASYGELSMRQGPEPGDVKSGARLRAPEKTVTCMTGDA